MRFLFLLLVMGLFLACSIASAQDADGDGVLDPNDNWLLIANGTQAVTDQDRLRKPGRCGRHHRQVGWRAGLNLLCAAIREPWLPRALTLTAEGLRRAKRRVRRRA